MDEKKRPRKYFQNSENHLFNMVRKQEKTGFDPSFTNLRILELFF